MLISKEFLDEFGQQKTREEFVEEHSWTAAVGQAWDKRRGRQPVSLPPSPCLVTTVED